MTQLQPVSLLSLPDEVIQTIKSNLPPENLKSILLTSRRLANIASEPLLWRSFCQSSFRWWDKRHDLQAKLDDTMFSEWKNLFERRSGASRETREILNTILENETLNVQRISQILERVGYDVKDVLIEAFYNAAGSEKHLAAR